MRLWPSTNQKFIKRLTALAEANMKNEHFGVSRLAKEMGISRSTLYLKVKSITKLSGCRFLRQLRLEKAMTLLRQTSLTVSDVAYEVGFGSPTYFIKCFHEYYGLTPGEVQKEEVMPPSSSESSTEEQNPGVARRRPKIIIVLLSTTLLLLGGLSWVLMSPHFLSKGKDAPSIAVLPFIDDSPEAGNGYIVDGLMEEILNKLLLIDNLEVVSRTTSEQYRHSEKTMEEISKELHTDYILEGSAQTIDNTIRIRLQLIEAATDRHLWSMPYERKVNTQNIFRVQKELALLVAHELDAIITHGGKTPFVKRPTQNITAYNLYLRGMDYKRLFEYRPIPSSWRELPKAKQLFKQAIQLDSTFVEAYVQLGDIYLNRTEYWGDNYHPDLYLDSGLIAIDKALLLDKNNWEAQVLKGQYFLKKGFPEKANELFVQLPMKASNIHDYYEAAFSHYLLTEDYYNALQSFFKYEELRPPDLLIPPNLLSQICYLLSYTGYPELAENYAEQLLSQHNDSLAYFNILTEIETLSGNFQLTTSYGLKSCQMDSTNTKAWYYLMIKSVWLHEYSAALQYLQHCEKRYMNGPHAIIMGFVYQKNGMPKEADVHFKKAIEFIQGEIGRNSVMAKNYYSHAFLACVYSVTGKKEKALDFLEQLKKRETNPRWLILCMKTWPQLDNIRQEPAFKAILSDMEAKYQQEHLRVRDLLRKQKVIK